MLRYEGQAICKDCLPLVFRISLHDTVRGSSETVRLVEKAGKLLIVKADGARPGACGTHLAVDSSRRVSSLPPMRVHANET